MKENGEEDKLKGLEFLTHEQLFFVSYAQVFIFIVIVYIIIVIRINNYYFYYLYYYSIFVEYFHTIHETTLLKIMTIKNN